MKRFFTLEYWQDDGWFVGRLKEVPGVFSQGPTLEELKENIADAYRMMLGVRRRREATSARYEASRPDKDLIGNGCYRSHGSKHDIYANTRNGSPVPRHAEIRDSLARLIKRQLSI